MKIVFYFALLLSACVVAGKATKEPKEMARQDFSQDPDWDAYNNRILPDAAMITRQQFGWSQTNHAGGKTKGEIGGRVQRSVTPASYAKVIAERTLNDRIRASGRFAVTHDPGHSGMLFGFFNENSHGWRANNSLVLRLDGNANGYIVFYEYGTGSYLAHGGGAFEGERWQTTSTKPKRPDGTSHTWILDYDPSGAGGNGLITFTLDGETFKLPLLAGHKKDDATFNRFGILNLQTTGEGMEVWFDDLEINGEPLDLATDLQWEGKGNRVEFVDRIRRPLQDFGYSPQTHHAGGETAGEIGGIFWRDETPSFYAGRVGPLDLEREMIASGTLAFCKAGSDSGVWLGWFDAASRKASTARPNEEGNQSNYIGILIEGPSRVGHYFRAGYRTSAAEGRTATDGPLIRPDRKVHQWTLHYRPSGANDNGQIEVTLDGSIQRLDLRPGDRQRGATFDRFGFFTAAPGGHHVEIYIDDLTYTTGERE